MNFSQAEAQLLATLLALETEAWEWRDGRRERITRKSLREHGREFFAEALAPWTGAFESLGQRGLLREEADTPKLTPDGREPASRLRRRFQRRRLAQVLLQAEHSTTYRTFCQRTGNLAFPAFSPLDALQFDALLEALRLAPGQHLLDAGCGTGQVTEEIVRRTGCRATGLDLLPEAVEIARRRTAADDHLSFLVRDLSQDLDAPAESPLASDFDAGVAVDSLGFLDDSPAVRALPRALQRLARRLRSGGVLVLLGLEIATDDGPSALPTTVALDELGLPFERRDLTAPCRDTLRARQFAARSLVSRFQREGHRLLGRSLLQEASRLAPALESGALRRILYRVGPVTGEMLGSGRA